MKFLLFIIVAMLIAGCCSSKDVVKNLSIPFTPHPISDSVAQLQTVLIPLSCDSIVLDVLQKSENYTMERINAEGDKWQLRVLTILDSTGIVINNQIKQIRFLRAWKLDVQPHKDSTIVPITVREIQPISLWQKIKLAMAVPLFILLGGVCLLVVLSKWLL